MSKNFQLYPHALLWFTLRSIMVVFALVIFWGLATDVKFDWLHGVSMREIFWIILMPIAVMTMYFAPMLWRNVCPLATANLWYFSIFGRRQLTEFGLKANQRNGVLGKTHAFLKKKGLLISAFLFWLIVPMRLVFFNMSADATFWLLLIVFLLAMVMGWLFPVKSGWCTSICPVSAVEKVYGLNPAVAVPNTRCHFYSKEQGRVLNCSGCSFNCSDVVDPEHAYWQAASNKIFHDTLNAKVRKVFLATLPAFLLSFYLMMVGIVSLPRGEEAAQAVYIYSFFGINMFLSFTFYTVLKIRLRRRVRAREGRLTLEQPSALYTLYKHRLDLCFVTVTMNIIWSFSIYAAVYKVFGKIWHMAPADRMSMVVLLSILFFCISLLGLRDGWNEDFRPSHHRSHWW